MGTDTHSSRRRCTGSRQWMLSGPGHGDGLGRASLLTGPLGLENGAVLTGGYTSAAGDALFMVRYRPDDSQYVMASLGQAWTHRVARHPRQEGPHGDLGHRTLVTGDRQHLHQAGVALVPSHSQLDPAVDDGPLLINTAAQRGRGPGMIFSGMSRIAVPVWSLSSQVRRATSVSTAVFNSWIFVSNVRIVSLFSLPVPFSRWHLLFFPQLLQVFFHFLCHFIATLPPLSIQISNSFPLMFLFLFGHPSPAAPLPPPPHSLR